MRLTQQTLRAAILTTVMVAIPVGSSFGQGFFGGQGGGGGGGGRRVLFGNDGGEGGPSTNDWLPGLLEGGLDLLDRIDQDQQFIDEGPDDDYVPVRPRPRPRPPVEQPRPNKIPAKPVEAKKNVVFTPMMLTAADIQQLKDQAKDQINQDRQDLKDMLPSKADTEAFLISKGVSAVDAKQIASEMESGFLNPASVAVLNGAGLSPADQGKIAAVLEGHKQINAAADAAISGNLSNNQLQDLATALGPFVPPGSPGATNANNILNNMGTSAGLMDMLNTAQAGLNSIPGGGNVLLGLIPGLPPGTVIPLGPGAALVGTSLLGPGSGPMITTGSVAGTLGMPVGSNPVAESEAKLVTEGVYLVNRTDTEVNYVLNGKSYTMQPGYTQTLSAGKTWSISFDKGNDQGTARYTLDEGTYAFNTTDAGWDLFKQSFSVTVDNSKNTFEFNYVLNNKAMVLAAGTTKDHTSPYPMQIRFDSGTGKTKQKKLEKGVFEVGLALADNSIELFDGQADGNPLVANAAGTGISLFGNTPATGAAGATGGGGVSLFGGSAGNPNAPWRQTDYFGGGAATTPGGSSFLAPTAPRPTAGAATPPAPPVKAVQGTLAGSSLEESVAPAPAPAP